MNIQRRSLRQQAQVEAPPDLIDQRQARYDRTRSEMDQQIDRVRTSIKEMIIYGLLAVGVLILLVGFFVALFGNLKDFIATSGAFVQLLVNWVVPVAIAGAAIWLLQRCYQAWTVYWLDDVELKRLRAEVEEMKAETKREDKLVE